MGSDWIIIVVGAAAAGFVQGLSGFGFGLTAMSFWAWTLDPRLAAALTVFGATSGQLLSATTVRRGFDAARLWPFIAGGLLGIPLGVMLLPNLDPPMFKLVLGLLLTIWCPAMLFAHRLPPVRAGGRLADGTSGLLGGVMGGIGGFTGVIPTLWCTLRGEEKHTQRSIIQNFNLATLLSTSAAYLVTGVFTRDMLPALGVVIPAMLIPSLLGARLYKGMSNEAFRKVVLGLLTASGAAMLISALHTLGAR